MKRQPQQEKLSDPSKPRLGEHMYQEPQDHSYGIDPEDGLPRLKTPPMEQTLAPPYSLDRFVCAGDNRLIDSHGNVYEESVVNCDDLGEYFYQTHEGRVRLRVVRPVCKHYKRQLVPFEDNDKFNKVERICTAAMNANGEYYSLEGQEVLACEFRDPRDPVSERLLDEHEMKILKAQEAAEEKQDDFDPGEALRGGIFKE